MRQFPLIVALCLWAVTLQAQYLANPSFEGPSLLGQPPDPWEICNDNSSPDTQPGHWNVTSPASDGDTYISMVCRGDSSALANQVESCGQQLLQPLLAGNEYQIRVDLMNSDQFGHLTNGGYWLYYDIPTSLRVTAGNAQCDEPQFIGQIGPVAALDWITWDYCFTPPIDLTYIKLEAGYMPDTTYFGVIFVDNMRITATPSELDLGPDLIVCNEESITLDAGPGWYDYEWINSVNSQTFEVTESGTYWVSVSKCGNVYSDTINVIIEGAIVEIEGQICEGASYAFADQLLTLPGQYADTIPTLNQCDSIINLNLELVDEYNLNLEAEICMGQTYLLGNQNIEESGIYTENLVSSAGCDSTITLDLTVNPLIVELFTEEICQGQSYIFAEQVMTEAGEYSDTLQTANFCDSLVILTLEFADILQGTLQAEICGEQSFFFQSQELTEPGTYIDTISTPDFCDSIAILELSRIDFLESEQVITICPDEFYFAEGADQNQAGTYIDTLQSLNFCDSIVTTDLRIANYDFETQDLNLCVGESYELNGRIITESGTYADTLNQSPDCPLILNSNFTFELCECNLIIPNAFSPNGDGLNDNFRAFGPCEVENVNFYVYDRWGKQVHHSTAINPGWDGTYNGEELPLGVYVWMLFYDLSTTNEIKNYYLDGNVTLIR